ncbi:MAG: phage portal protein [Aristaeellaceae bacterium]
MLTTSEIKKFMESDAASEKKRQASVGMRYYEADHDIRKYRIFYIDADGIVQEDKTKSNIKICHPFFTELVDQCAQYMLSGKDGFIRSDLPELQEKLDEYFNDNEDFMAELYDVLTGTQAKGFEYMYAYKGDDGKTRFECADSMGVVEVRARDTDDGCDYVIYCYVDRIGKDNKKIKRIQVWDETQTWFYSQVDDGDIQLDLDEQINPRPHTLYAKGKDGKTYFDGFGVIPFFRLDNCRKQVSDLKPIKALIDDYDLMSCGLSNNIQDTNEALYVVKGFEGDKLDEMMHNIKAKKHIGVSEGGDVEIRTIDIPYQARQAKLELDEKNIYRFGMGFNSAQIGDGNITNVVIKSRYALLDLKANKLEIRLKQFMRKLLKVVLKEINDTEGTDYQQSNVYFKFEREVITNASDNAQIELTDAQKQQVQINTLLGLENRLDNETMMQNICEVLDLEYEDLKDKLPKPDENDPYAIAQTALDNIPVDGSGG